MKQKVSTRITSVLLTVVMLLTAMPMGLSAGTTDNINDNVFLDALAYTGYKLTALKKDGLFLTAKGAIYHEILRQPNCYARKKER